MTRSPNASPARNGSAFAAPGAALVFALLLVLSIFSVLSAASPALGALAAAQGTDLWGGPGAKGGGVPPAFFDTTIYINGSVAATGTVDFFAGGSLVETVGFSLPGRGTVIVLTPASLLGRGAFLYHLRSDAVVNAWSETYNETASGRYGVSLAAFTASEFLIPGDEASGGGADASTSLDSGRARTNVGVLCNPGASQSCSIEVAAFDAGVLLGTGPVTAVPGSAAQGGLADLVPAAAGRPNLGVRVRVLSGSGQPYVIRNYNSTSDAFGLPLVVTRGAFSTAPSVTTFTVAPSTGCPPQNVTATWTTAGATKVTISGAAGDLPPSGTTTFPVFSTSDIVLTAYASSGATTTATRKVTLLPPTDPPTPSPASATVVPGSIFTGSIPFSSGVVTVTFDQQGSTGSSFVLAGQQFTYTAGSTAGSDVVRLTVQGACGPASAFFRATVTAPGDPAISSFTASPMNACAPADIILSWATQNVKYVDITPLPPHFTFGPNGETGATIPTSATFTLTAYGFGGFSQPTPTATVSVNVDTQTYTPILSTNNVLLPVNGGVVITITGVPDLTKVHRVYVHNESGAIVTSSGTPGVWGYTAGFRPGNDVIRFFYTNGCGPAYAEFHATVFQP